MELKSKISDAGLLYVPVELRQSFGKNVRISPNTVVALLYSESARLEDVRQSAGRLLEDLDLRISLERKATGGSPSPASVTPSRPSEEVEVEAT